MMVEVDQITRRFGSKTAVDDISFTVRPGEVLGVIGPNGAGKSTTMRILTGFLPPTSGEVRINGILMSHDPLKAKSLIGYLPENAPLYAGMTVRSFLSYIAALRGVPAAELPIRMDRAIRDCRLERVLDQGVETLSKGFRHRVCLAQSLIHDPKVLVLDEPTDGLDPNQKNEVRQLIRRLGAAGKTVILSTHILEEVEEVCSRVVVIAGGKKLFDGTVSALRKINGAGTRLHVEASGGDSVQLEKLLVRIGGEVEVKTAGLGRMRALMRLRDGSNAQQIRASIIETLKSNGWLNIEVIETEPTLDESFTRLTRKGGDA